MNVYAVILAFGLVVVGVVAIWLLIRLETADQRWLSAEAALVEQRENFAAQVALYERLLARKAVA